MEQNVHLKVKISPTVHVVRIGLAGLQASVESV